MKHFSFDFQCNWQFWRKKTEINIEFHCNSKKKLFMNDSFHIYFATIKTICLSKSFSTCYTMFQSLSWLIAALTSIILKNSMITTISNQLYLIDSFISIISIESKIFVRIISQTSDINDFKNSTTMILIQNLINFIVNLSMINYSIFALKVFSNKSWYVSF